MLRLNETFFPLVHRCESAILVPAAKRMFTDVRKYSLIHIFTGAYAIIGTLPSSVCRQPSAVQGGLQPGGGTLGWRRARAAWDAGQPLCRATASMGMEVAVLRVQRVEYSERVGSEG